MYFDSVREQGEKLGLFGANSDEQSSFLGKGRPIAGAMNAKKMRKVIGSQNS